MHASPLRPTIPPPPLLNIPVPSRYRTSGGLDILVVHRPRLPLTDVLLVMRSGAADDPTDLAGRACLTAELLDAGTATRSEPDIARELERLGARFDASAAWDCTSLVLQCLSVHLEAALEVLADIAAHAAFPEPEFARGRQERLAAIMQDLDDPEMLANRAIARAIYGEQHVYGTPSGGTLKTVQRLERSALVAFHSTHYRPANAFLVLVGDVPAQTATGMVERVFEGWPAGPERSLPQPSALTSRPGAIHLLHRPGAPQSEFRIGAVGAARTSPDFFPLLVLNTILGGSFTSRLNLRLREQSAFTYGAFSHFSFRRWPGPFIAGAGVQTEVTHQAIAQALEEFAKLRESPVHAEELARAKRYLTLGLLREFETNGSVASRLAEAEVYGLGQEYWSKYAGEVEAAGADAVLDAAQRYLDPQRMTLAVVGDADVVRAPVDALGIGPVVEGDLAL